MRIDPFENPAAYKVSTTIFPIKVTPALIQQGVRGDALTCPVAFAIRKWVKGDVLVTTRHAMFYNKRFTRVNADMALGKHRVATIYLPEDVTKRIKAYEAGEEMEPFEFQLELPNSQIRINIKRKLDK